MRKYSSYLLFLLLAILVVILSVNRFGPLQSLQQSIDDLLCSITAEEGARPNVVTVTIDGRAQAEYGPWPWSHDLIADLVAASAAGEPRAIAVGVDLSENAVEDSLGNTAILAEQLSWIDNVVLPYDISLASFRSNVTGNPEHLFNYSVSVDNPLGLMQEDASLIARKTFLPAARLLETDPALGFDYVQPDHDRVLRHQSMLVHFEGYYYPALPLMAAAAFRGVRPSDIRIVEGQEIHLGAQAVIPINERGEYYVHFQPEGSIGNYSASDVLSDNFNRAQLKGRLVLIGLNDIAARETFRTPLTDQATKLQIQAAVAENVINGDFLTPQRSAGTGILIMLVLGAFFGFLLPQVPMMYRFVILIGALILLANVNYFMVSSFHVIPQTVYIALELFLFLCAVPMLDSELIRGEESTRKKETDALDPLSRQVRPEDIAAAPIREIHERPNDPHAAPTTAVDFASAGLAMSQADSASDTIIDHSAIDIDRPLNLDEPPAAPKREERQFDTSMIDDSDIIIQETPSASGPEIITPDSRRDDRVLASPAADDGPAQSSDSGSWDQSGQTPLPQKLGRYQIQGKLGKGAMGLVYKGVDPAINRPVALKTIRLDFVSDPEEMKELKERLYREAQAAGKLSHPNIVTIYDVGSDGPLQYIAMEYLEGRTLEDMIKKKTKFNYRIIAEIITQICSALQYAHEQGIVHRDIKPANIMILKDYRVKVMDYGIARIDTNSMTKTGIAMGTPNYISPEQLKGQKSDHRADIFSLGVVMYEMLLGKRPFKGENITSLIYTIINHEPDKPSDVNPQIPLLFDHVIMKALAKDPQRRYQRAAEIATDLRDFVESFAPKA